MFVAHLIIDAPDILVFVRDTPGPVEDLPARVVRRQVDPSEDLQRRSSVPTRIDPVVQESAAVQVNARACVERRPVAVLDHGPCGNECAARCWVLSQNCALIAAEEKEPVRHNGTPDRAAELVALESAALPGEGLSGGESC